MAGELTQEDCKVCWIKYGRFLWKGSCVCTGDVSLASYKPTYSNPLKTPIEPEVKVLQQGDFYVIRKVWPDGRCDRVGPEKGEQKAGSAPFPKKLLELWCKFESKEEADKILVQYKAYLTDYKRKKK